MRGRAVILKKRTPSSQIRQKTASYDYSHPEMGGFFLCLYNVTICRYNVGVVIF